MNRRSRSRRMRKFYSEIRFALRDAFARIESEPIFIFGNPKSGTTIIGFLFAKASGFSYTADILRAIPDAALSFQLEYELLSVADLSEKYRFEFSRKIIKEPMFTFQASSFLDSFERSSSLFVFRDPRDNLRSILQRLQIPGHLDSIHTEDWEQIKRTPAWKIVLFDRWRHDGHSTNYIDALAYNWNRCYYQYAKNCSRCTVILYEDFVFDKIGAINRLLNQLNIKEKNDISGYIDKQVQPKGDRDIDLVSFFGQKNIKRIEAICAEGILALGYRPSIL